MKFKAISTFTVFHEDQMHVFNTDTRGELPDAVMAQFVAAGLASEIKGKAAKADPAPVAEDAPPAIVDEDAPPA